MYIKSKGLLKNLRGSTSPIIMLSMQMYFMEPCAVTIQKRRLKWLGHALRMKEDAIPNAALVFEKGDNWRCPPGRTRKTWGKIVKDELNSQVKPPIMTLKVWDKEWFDICKERAMNRNQWRGLIRDLNVAVQEQQCLQ